MEGNFLCVPTDVWNIFPLSAAVPGPQSWADKERWRSHCKALLSRDVRRNRLLVYICDCHSFSSTWILTLFPRGELQMRDESPLTSASVLPWVYGEFCEYKLWLRQMIIHCWWAGSSAVLLHQRQCQSLQHKHSPNATQDVTETPSRFISHAGKPVLNWSYCVLSPLYCRHRRWLWT